MVTFVNCNAATELCSTTIVQLVLQKTTICTTQNYINTTVHSIEQVTICTIASYQAVSIVVQQRIANTIHLIKS